MLYETITAAEFLIIYYMVAVQVWSVAIGYSQRRQMRAHAYYVLAHDYRTKSVLMELNEVH